MLRKFFAAIMAAILVIGSLFAEEFKGIFKKYENGKITLDVDGKIKEYKIDPNGTFKAKNKEFPLKDALKFAKEGATAKFEVVNGVIIKVSPVPEMKKKKKLNN